MSFASPIFLWYFLPLTLLTYWILPARFRNALLSVVSLVFYVFGGLSFVFALLGVIALNYAAGLAIDSEALHRTPGRRKALLVATVGTDLGILGFWKYGGFATTQIHNLAKAFGQDSSPILSVALPIGISFFTFHHLSYVVDVYRHSRKAQRSPVQFITYIAMFPQLVAGPIIRYHEIAEQLSETRKDRFGDFAAGMPRFSLGLAKKVIVADTVAPIADTVFRLDSTVLTTPSAWLGVLAYTLQIYFDFSGYSDMAIGLARMFGLHFPENFNRPYSSVNITDFWQRWHMSLSRWFRDYLYIPLGGNRGSTFSTYRNLMIIFVASGFWHGAAWTFLIWGLYHGGWLIIERATGLAKIPDDKYVLPRRAITFLLVMFGWVFFRAQDMGNAGHIFKAMFSFDFGPTPAEVSRVMTDFRTMTIVLAFFVVFVPRGFVMGRLLDESRGKVANALRLGYTGIAAPYAAVIIAAGTLSPFLYFKF
jgi:alginate O-acetyltransferase complex protein AlgI